jgi:hypothetical protein
MSSTITALGRQKTYRSGTWLPYRGYHKEYPLKVRNFALLDKFEEEADLWYLEFRYENRWFLAAGCVFDIDVSGPLQQQVYMATLAKNVPALLRLLHPTIEIIKKEFAELPYRIFASGSKGLHVYVKNPNGFLVSSQLPEQAFTSAKIQAFLERHYSSDFLSLIDKSPYPHNKGIRPARCQHPKTQIDPFILLTSASWDLGGDAEREDDSWLHWATLMITSDLLAEEQQEPVGLPPNVVAVSRPPALNVPISDQENSAFFDGPINSWLERESGLRPWSENQRGKFLVYTCSGERGTWCPIAQKIHKTQCTAWDARFENGTKVAFCFNAKCSGKRFVLRLPIIHPITRPNPAQVPEERVIKYENLPNMRYLPTTQLIQDIETHKNLVICAPMGSGKTYSIVKWIEEKNPARVLIIGTRIQQIAAWHSKFAYLGFKNYEAVQGSLFREDRVLVCLNSLPRLLGAMEPDGFRPLPKYDALIIDEADSLARWLGGALLTESPVIFEILKVLVSTSTYVMCMDGIPTLALGSMLEQFGAAAKFKWLSFQSMKFKEWIFVNNHEYFTSSYLNALRSGKKLFFVTNSKTAVFRFYDLAVKEIGLAENKVLAIHGEMSRTIRDQSGNPDDWVRYDLILANGSLGPGASFDHLHFHQVYCLVDVKCGVIPAEIGQLIERPRKLINNQVMIMVLKKPYNQYLASQAHDVDQFKSRQKAIGDHVEIAREVGDWRPSSDPLPLRQPTEQDGPPLPIYMQLQHTRDPAMLTAPVPRNVVRVGGRAGTLPLGSPVVARRQTTIVTLPTYNEETDTLESEIVQGEYGLVFEQTPLIKLQVTVLNQMNDSCTDSEIFLKHLQKICTLNGAGFTTKGPRQLLDDKGNCRVLGAHMGYIKALGKRTVRPEEDDQQQQEISGDWDKCQSDPIFLQIEQKYPPVTANKLKALLYCKTCSVSTRLKRLRSLANSYKGTEESVKQQINKDTVRLFQVAAEQQNAAVTTRNQQTLVRPESISRVCYNQKITNGELFGFIHLLLHLMGFSMLENGEIVKPANDTGRYCTLSFIQGENQQAWWDVVRACVYVFRKENYTNTFKIATLIDNSDRPANIADLHAIVFSHVITIFEFVGIPLVKSHLMRKKLTIDGEAKKRQWFSLSLDEKLYNVHLALLGKSEKTLDELVDVMFPTDQ